MSHIANTVATRFSRVAVAAAGLFVLMACKTETCGGVETSPPVEPACKAGFHEEEICQGECPPGEYCDAVVSSCELACVPDAVCPEGSVEETVCDDSVYPVDCVDGESCTPPEPQCYTTCTPIAICPAGMHEEEVCWYEDGAEGAPDCVDGQDCGGGGGCDIQCVPDAVCPPGEHEEQLCWEEPVECAPGEDCGGFGCELQCVPDDVCPPGTEPQTICTYCEDSECWTECVPVGEPTPEPAPLPGDDARRSR